MTTWNRLVLALGLLGALGYAYWKFAIPIHRVEVRSELVMLGDLNGDRRWTADDLRALETFLQDPFTTPDAVVWRLDLNQNGLIDAEDTRILQALVAAGEDPYAAQEASQAQGHPFPRPRELYRYVSVAEYHPRPLWALPYPRATDSILDWLPRLHPPTGTGTYAEGLDAALYAEAGALRSGLAEAPG